LSADGRGGLVAVLTDGSLMRQVGRAAR